MAMTPSPPDSSQTDPLKDVLREAQATPDPIRAQALEDRLTARLQQLTSQSERKSNMQAQMVYTRRPSTQNFRLWNNLAGVLALAACAALVVAFFPRQTPPDNNVAAPIGVNTSPTEPPMMIIVPTSTPFSAEVDPTVIPVLPTTTMMDGGSMPTIPPMTATPIPCCGNPADISVVTATPTALGEGFSPLMSVSLERLHEMDAARNLVPTNVRLGNLLLLYLPVATSTELSEDTLSEGLADGTLEALPFATARVVGITDEGRIELIMNEPTHQSITSLLFSDETKALILFRVIEE